MALIYMDGFDVGDYATRWVRNGLNTDFDDSVLSRFGAGKTITFPTSTSTTSRMSILHGVPASPSLYIGAAMKLGCVSMTYTPLSCAFGIYTDSGTMPQVYMRRTSANGLQVYRGNPATADNSNPQGTLLASSIPGIVDYAWHYYEMYVMIHATAGRVTVKVDGNTVIDFTGNTKNTGTSTNIDGIMFSGGVWSSDRAGMTTIDDFYVCDGTGTTNNTFLGDVRVQTLMPDGAGSSTQLAPTGSTTNWQNVAEVPYNATTYNSSAAVGERDMYTLGNVAANTSTIFGVQSVAHMLKTGAGTANARVAIKSGATLSYDTTRSLGTSDFVYTQVRETDPNTSTGWTPAGVNGIEMGVEVS